MQIPQEVHVVVQVDKYVRYAMKIAQLTLDSKAVEGRILVRVKEPAVMVNGKLDDAVVPVRNCERAIEPLR